MERKPLAEVQRDLPGLVAHVVAEHDHVVITRDDKCAAVLMSADEYDSLRETLDVLAGDELVRDIREGLADADAGRLVSHHQVIADLEARRNGPDAGSGGMAPGSR